MKICKINPIPVPGELQPYLSPVLLFHTVDPSLLVPSLCQAPNLFSLINFPHEVVISHGVPILPKWSKTAFCACHIKPSNSQRTHPQKGLEGDTSGQGGLWHPPTSHRSSVSLLFFLLLCSDSYKHQIWALFLISPQTWSCNTSLIFSGRICLS